MPKLTSESGPANLALPGALALSPSKTAKALDCGLTSVYALIAQGELETYIDGSRRKITVESIHNYIARRLAASRGLKVKVMPKRFPTTEESDAR